MLHMRHNFRICDSENAIICAAVRRDHCRDRMAAGQLATLTLRRCGIIFAYAILKMPSYAEKYALCGFFGKIWDRICDRIFAYNQHL